jgi:F-type H+-transporting ATPase subunit delta
MRGGEAAARRYARALLDVALAKGDRGVGEALEMLARLYRTHADLRAVLVHPGVPAEKKTAVVAAVLRDRPSALLEKLVGLLVQRDRIELLPLIADAFRRLWNVQAGVVEAEAVSARELDDKEARAVADAVSRAAGGKQVDLRRSVDPALMGGVLLRMEGRVYDGSVRARLRALRERLAGGDAS